MSVQRLGERRYRIWVDVGRDAQGRRQRHSEVFRGTKAEAERRERELRRSLDTGTYVDPRTGTVAEYLHRWLTSVKTKVAENTYRSYEQKVRTHLIPDLGHVKLSDLRPLHIEEVEARWLVSGNRRTRGPLGPRSVLHLHRCLHTALERAVKWKLLAVNPVDGVEPPYVPDREMGFLTAEESERLVAALIDREYELPILVGLYCGLRPTEYLGLRWRDVEPLDAGELRVMQNVYTVRQDRITKHMGEAVEGFRFGPTKTHRSKRPVSMPAVVVELLRAWRPVQDAQKAAAGPAWTSLDLVFTDARGYPYKLDRVRDRFHEALDEAGLRRVRLYDLRHTMATLVLKETKDLKLVAARLGHASEYLVLKTYGHLLPGADREAADRLGTLIRRSVPTNGVAPAGHTDGTRGGPHQASVRPREGG